ncbi:Fumarylacetoacetase [Hondaea fermentalgiana]|uniref:Fumarylacetoacetase n=1 Tax=Hondaea fermentalgiana TaxID=2315210 RepID=A0A2R5GMB3_9STRA|nr:Fumarylacetoacetase [Hondaea fermentalgiana]|eukprot:GBG29773.1 Fumarylacetoacetase [Hondaea fermentalgiana]
MGGDMESFVEVDAASHFPVQNLPYGVFSSKNADAKARVGTRIGDFVVDLAALHEAGLFEDAFDSSCFTHDCLNAFMGMGRSVWTQARKRLQQLLSKDEPKLRDDADLRARVLIPVSDVEMQLPAKIGDYTDFYASRQHATNVGTMFRGKENALPAAWMHMPIGYHGRASTVVKSGTAVRRPCGQVQKDPADPKQGSVYGACKLLDFELEMGVFVGPGNKLGSPIKIEDAEDHIFGFVLLNDWSARDIQKFEYVPLGPFGAKNFASSISPWVVTTDALKPFTAKTSAGEQNDPEPLPYLREPGYSTYDIRLEVAIQAEDIGPEPFRVCESNYRHMYWTHRQQLAHHTVTGCEMRPGDLLGSGTISGDEEGSFGSMLEICWKGTKPIQIKDGVERKFIKDDDTVIMTGWCEGEGYRVGFGECTGKILPAQPQ